MMSDFSEGFGVEPLLFSFGRAPVDEQEGVREAVEGVLGVVGHADHLPLPDEVDVVLGDEGAGPFEVGAKAGLALGIRHRGRRHRLDVWDSFSPPIRWRAFYRRLDDGRHALRGQQDDVMRIHGWTFLGASNRIGSKHPHIRCFPVASDVEADGFRDVALVDQDRGQAVPAIAGIEVARDQNLWIRRSRSDTNSPRTNEASELAEHETRRIQLSLMQQLPLQRPTGPKANSAVLKGAVERQRVLER